MAGVKSGSFRASSSSLSYSASPKAFISKPTALLRIPHPALPSLIALEGEEPGWSSEEDVSSTLPPHCHC